MGTAIKHPVPDRLSRFLTSGHSDTQRWWEDKVYWSTLPQSQWDVEATGTVKLNYVYTGRNLFVAFARAKDEHCSWSWRLRLRTVGKYRYNAVKKASPLQRFGSDQCNTTHVIHSFIHLFAQNNWQAWHKTNHEQDSKAHSGSNNCP